MHADETMNEFWSAFRAGRWAEVFTRYLADDCEFVMPGLPPLRGRTQIAPLFEAYLTAFPDFSVETLHAISSGDTWAAESRYQGTHAGPLSTADGEVPPTQRVVQWQSADLVRFRDGRIASWHVYHDRIAFLAQLGVALG